MEIEFGAPGTIMPPADKAVEFARRAEADLAGTLLLQWPWAVRSYEEMAQALATQGLYVNVHVEMTPAIDAFLAQVGRVDIESLGLEHQLNALRCGAIVFD